MNTVFWNSQTIIHQGNTKEMFNKVEEQSINMMIVKIEVLYAIKRKLR